MTREEAIEKLKFESVRQQLMWDNELNEAMRMAIKALGQEPCEDAISRRNSMTELERLLSQDDACLVSVASVKRALEHEPCEDAISRAEVYAMLKGMLDDHNDSKEHQMVSIAYIEQELSDLPPVTPKQKMGRWIDVSERLPEDGQNVLFCDIDEDIMIGYHVKGRPVTHFSQDGTWEDMKNVRAWMPLPKPYEPQESEDTE